MTWVNPPALLLLLPAAVLMVWRYRRLRRRRLAVPTLRLWRLALESSEGGTRSRHRLPLEFLLEVLALFSAIVAAADPRVEWPIREERVVIVLDVGGAMNAPIRRGAAGAAIERFASRARTSIRVIEVPAAAVVLRSGDGALSGPFDIARELAMGGSRVVVVTDDELPAITLPRGVEVVRASSSFKNAGIIAARTDADSRRLFVSVGRTPSGPRDVTLRVKVGPHESSRRLDLSDADRAETDIDLGQDATTDDDEISIGIEGDDDWAEDDDCILTRVRGSDSLLVDAGLLAVAEAAEAAGYQVTLRSGEVTPPPSAIVVTRDDAVKGPAIIVADPTSASGPFGGAKERTRPRVAVHHPILAELDPALFARGKYRAVAATDVEALVSLDDDIVIGRQRGTRRMFIGLDLTNDEIVATVDFPRLWHRLFVIAGVGGATMGDREFDVVACGRPLAMARRDPIARLRRFDDAKSAVFDLPEDTLDLAVIPFRPGRYGMEDRFGTVRFTAAVLSSTETMRIPAGDDVPSNVETVAGRRSISVSGIAAAMLAFAVLVLTFIRRRRDRPAAPAASHVPAPGKSMA